MSFRRLSMPLAAMLVVPLTAAGFGGWAAITVETLPEYAVAGQPVRLAFTIRQHGVTLLGDLKPTIEFSPGGGAQVAATSGKTKGQYEGTFTVPQAGQAAITINSGFGRSRVTLLPMMVVAPGAGAPASLPEAERGRHLFVAKGCFNCHAQRYVEAEPIGAIGPDLTDRHLAADYLRQQIGNPPASGRMPNLGLQTAEIESIISFLNAEQQAAR